MLREHSAQYDTSTTSKILKLEEALRLKDERYIDLEQEYNEFKR